MGWGARELWGPLPQPPTSPSVPGVLASWLSFWLLEEGAVEGDGRGLEHPFSRALLRELAASLRQCLKPRLPGLLGIGEGSVLGCKISGTGTFFFFSLSPRHL